ncbi:hypothetical protein [Actinomadura flavalba]|uniref:hypothetical protein n=1 Tax=Actinomadura flavalba TaxID=1120938 RepID=UPI0003AA1163|nr:hypothetical protein [Actinomadura flavalba]
MSNPQWPGQPGYPPHNQPPPPPGPFPPGYGPPPPPRRGGSGPLVALLVGGLIVVVAVVAVAVLVLSGGDDRRTIATPTVTPTFPTFEPPTPPPTPTYQPSTPSTMTLDSLLGPTFKTFRGNTFTRGGTMTSSCTARANSTLLPVLSDNPCTTSLRSAVYANPSKSIISVVSIAQFSDASAAQAVSTATNRNATPKLLMPSTESGLPRLPKEPPAWNRSWTLGDKVIYVQSYEADGSSPGPRDGQVYTTAGELGTEVVNALRFMN